jgi:hypothetical protein
MGKNEIDQKWIDEMHRTRYPSGMKVYYSVDELLEAIDKGEVGKTAPVGLCYHALAKANQIGMCSRQAEQIRRAFAKKLHENVVILVSVSAFLDRFG